MTAHHVGRRPLARGTCQVCRTDRALATDGLIRGHALAHAAPRCAGSWEKPVDGSVWIPTPGQVVDTTRREERS